MSFKVEYFTLDSTQAANRYIEISSPPSSPSQIALDLIGGTAQSLSGDFDVDSSRIRWDNTSYGLYGMLSVGDKVRVIYDRA